VHWAVSAQVPAFFGVFHQSFQDISPLEKVESVSRTDFATRRLAQNFIGKYFDKLFNKGQWSKSQRSKTEGIPKSDAAAKNSLCKKPIQMPAVS
jgi:hypothetical protein